MTTRGVDPRIATPSIVTLSIVNFSIIVNFSLGECQP